MKKNLCLTCALLMVLVAGWGCGGGDNNSSSLNGSSTTDDQLSNITSYAKFQLTLLDSPVDDAEAVYVTINQISVHLAGALQYGGENRIETVFRDGESNGDGSGNESGAGVTTQAAGYGNGSGTEGGGEQANGYNMGDAGNARWIDLAITSQRYNLLELQNNLGVLLADQDLPAGQYTQLRLMLDLSEGNAPSIVIDGEEYDLTVSSGCRTGLIITHAFTVEEGVTTQLLLDFDVRNSIHVTDQGEYMLRPTIRLVHAGNAGCVQGQILPVDIGAVVYVFESGTYDPLAVDPLTNAKISAIPMPSGRFCVPALPVGVYDLVIAAEGYITDTSQTGIEVVAGGKTELPVIELLPETDQASGA